LIPASKYILKFIDDGGELNFTERGCEHIQISQINNYFVKINSSKKLDGKEVHLLPPLNEDEDEDE